jgi:hypothetical protein
MTIVRFSDAEMLDDLRGAAQISHLRSAKMAHFWRRVRGDAGFAEQARTIVADKIAGFERGEHPLIKGTALALVLNGWRGYLSRIEPEETVAR